MIVVADWSNGSEGRKMRIGGQSSSMDCDADQQAVEKQHWSGMIQYFGLPNTCAVTQRMSGPVRN
jgi:hypothetical protein